MPQYRRELFLNFSGRHCDRLPNRVALSLSGLGLCPGDAVAIVMPMTAEAVAAYPGVIKAGCTVVPVAGGFAPDEIRTRLRIARTEVVFTQDVILKPCWISSIVYLNV